MLIGRTCSMEEEEARLSVVSAGVAAWLAVAVGVVQISGRRVGEETEQQAKTCYEWQVGNGRCQVSVPCLGSGVWWWTGGGGADDEARRDDRGAQGPRGPVAGTLAGTWIIYGSFRSRPARACMHKQEGHSSSWRVLLHRSIAVEASSSFETTRAFLSQRSKARQTFPLLETKQLGTRVWVRESRCRCTHQLFLLFLYIYIIYPALRIGSTQVGQYSADLLLVPESGGRCPVRRIQCAVASIHVDARGLDASIVDGTGPKSNKATRYDRNFMPAHIMVRALSLLPPCLKVQSLIT